MKTKPPLDHLELGLFGHARALITIGEAATALIVSEQKAREWEQDEWLKGVEIGDGPSRKHVRINRASAEALYVFRMSKRGVVPPYRLSPEAQWFLDQMKEREQMGSHLAE
jgi:hypothetical protein